MVNPTANSQSSPYEPISNIWPKRSFIPPLSTWFQGYCILLAFLLSHYFPHYLSPLQVSRPPPDLNAAEPMAQSLVLPVVFLLNLMMISFDS